MSSLARQSKAKGGTTKVVTSSDDGFRPLLPPDLMDPELVEMIKQAVPAVRGILDTPEAKEIIRRPISAAEKLRLLIALAERQTPKR